MSQLTLGQRIASRRKQINMSQEALAEQLGVSRQAVSKWESDSTIPEIDKLIALGKLFGVSIGWILGVEAETSADLSEEQIKTVEELIVRYQKPRRNILWVSLIACILAIVCFLSAYFSQHIQRLNEENLELYDQISALNADNSYLKNEMSDMSALLEQQTESKRLLSDVHIQAFADDDLKNASITYYMTPKVYLSSNKAYLSVQNPNINYNEMIECVWSEYQGWYVARFTLPITDGYKWSFLLVNEYGYEEENLMLRDSDLTYTGTNCGFHFSPLDSQFDRMRRNEARAFAVSKTAYTFDHPVYTPHIFAKTAIAYKNIDIALTLNGETIWEKSYLDEFKQALNGRAMNAGNNAVQPGIKIALPQLQVGDELKLVLTAETANGGAPTQSYETLLDYLVVTE